MSHLQFTSLHWLIVGSDERRDGLDKMQPWQGQSRRASLCSWLPGQGEFLPVPWLSCKSSLCRFVVCLRCEVKHVSLNLTERLRKARFYSAFAACQAMVTCWCDSSHLIDTFYWCSIFAQYFQRLLRLVICFSLSFFFFFFLSPCKYSQAFTWNSFTTKQTGPLKLPPGMNTTVTVQNH